MERSRKAAQKSDREKAKNKARLATKSSDSVPEYIPDCVRSAYKKSTANNAKRGKKNLAVTKAAKGNENPTGKGKKATARSTRRTAEEQAAYDRTMTALDKLIGKKAEEATQELDDEEEEDSRPMTRGRNRKKD